METYVALFHQVFVEINLQRRLDRIKPVSSGRLADDYSPQQLSRP
jgi:hypothetical protein